MSTGYKEPKGGENHSYLLRIYVSISETLGFSYGEEIIDTHVPLRKASQEAHSRFNNNPYSSPEMANGVFDFLITAADA